MTLYHYLILSDYLNLPLITYLYVIEYKLGTKKIKYLEIVSPNISCEPDISDYLML
jgi:hypothetical protein